MEAFINRKIWSPLNLEDLEGRKLAGGSPPHPKWQAKERMEWERCSLPPSGSLEDVLKSWGEYPRPSIWNEPTGESCLLRVGDFISKRLGDDKRAGPAAGR